jgi:hypothetical protein
VLYIPKEDSLIIAGFHIYGVFNVTQDAISISMGNPDDYEIQMFLNYRERIDFLE